MSISSDLAKIGEVFKEVLDVVDPVAVSLEPIVLILDPAVAPMYDGAVAILTAVDGQLKLIPVAKAVFTTVA